MKIKLRNYAKMEEQCMEAQANELTDIKLRAKLKQVRVRLVKWKACESDPKKSSLPVQEL